MTKYFKKIPQKLLHIHDPPEKLFYKGDIQCLNQACLAIVGTRKATQYGKEVVKQLLEDLSIYKLTIISGLAYGIDTLVHKACLKFGLKTAAVIGSGLENIYPAENRNLAEDIVKQKGCIISEYEVHEKPLAFHFPQRNRLISGLADAVLVIEAPVKSGSLITAKFALQQGKEVLVVPGNINNWSSQGCLKLLQNGMAYPVGSGLDIISYLREQCSTFKTDTKDFHQLSFLEAKILGLVRKQKQIQLSDVHQEIDLPLDEILEAASILETYDLITRKGSLLRRK
jgi:DNA processing protein